VLRVHSSFAALPGHQHGNGQGERRIIGSDRANCLGVAASVVASPGTAGALPSRCNARDRAYLTVADYDTLCARWDGRKVKRRYRITRWRQQLELLGLPPTRHELQRLVYDRHMDA